MIAQPLELNMEFDLSAPLWNGRWDVKVHAKLKCAYILLDDDANAGNKDADRSTHDCILKKSFCFADVLYVFVSS
jgi:hypothetical protein